MQTDFDPSVPPRWLVKVRTVVYFVAKRWWVVVALAVILAKIAGQTWSQAYLLGLLVLAGIIAAPALLGVLIAFVSRSRRRRFENQ
jgi:hypothetical protein